MTHPSDQSNRDNGAAHHFSESELAAFKRTFENDGYLIFKGVVPRDKLAQLRVQLDEAFVDAQRTGKLISGGGTIAGHLNCLPGEIARFAYDALRERGILEVVQAVYPKSIDAFAVGCNYNLPNSIAQHYHMDGVYLDDFMIVNVAVVDTDLENGAIDLLPGTHQRFYKFYEYALGQKYKGTTRIPVSQGDVLVRKSTLWHRGMPNKTKVARPMLAFTMGEKMKVAPGDPFQTKGGKVEFYENWYRPNLLGRLRERTFVAAPITYSAYRFVRSLVGNKGYAHD
jgi:ectoine hydroxylase-related dioxygenase (phytanoyl-CoA dioxygenase family)